MLSGTFYSKTVFFNVFMVLILFPEFMGNNFWKFDENSMVGLLKLQYTCPEQCFLSRSSFSFIQFLIFRKITLTSGKDFCQGSWKSTLRVQMFDVWRKSFIWNNSTFLLLHHFWTLSGKNSTFGEKFSAKFFKNAI